MMTKYDALGEFLIASGQTEVKLSFLEIEKILGFKLPHSAYSYSAWWANGGHSQAEAWVSAGFLVKELNISHETVRFRKKDVRHHQNQNVFSASNLLPNQKKAIAANHPQEKQNRSGAAFSKSALQKTASPAQDNGFINVCGYEFHFIQQLIPECENGKVKEYYPQRDYNNKKNLPLLANGVGAFCRFSISAPAASGVYLWVADSEIIYIGETANLQQRFAMGYGNISPRNCYMGGQSTNCKMNKVVMEYYKHGRPIGLYFHQTENYKQVELHLLSRIHTKYNVKDN